MTLHSALELVIAPSDQVTIRAACLRASIGIAWCEPTALTADKIGRGTRERAHMDADEDGIGKTRTAPIDNFYRLRSQVHHPEL